MFLPHFYDAGPAAGLFFIFTSEKSIIHQWYLIPLKGGVGEMGDKGGKKDKAKTEKQAKTKKDKKKKK